ncbi:MAG: FAD-binding oxidoreductase [Candidatus Woesearchaeota archaeon]
MIEAFKTIVGKANYSERHIDKFSHRSDASRMSGIAEAVIWPTSIGQVHKIVGVAKRLNLQLQIRGGGTSLSGGSIPRKSIVLDTSRMTRIREYGDDYIVVEAGVVLYRLNKWLKKKGKFFPVVPESHLACTIGGMVATNASSGKRYGRMGGWIKAVEVVFGNGMREWLRGESLKHAVGLEGITGVITAVKLKVIDTPPTGSMDITRLSTIAALAEHAKKLENRDDIIDITYLDDTCSSLLGLEPFIHLMAHYSTAEGKISSEDEVRLMLEKREQLPFILKSSGYVAVEDPYVPPENAARFIYELRKSNIPTYGHMLHSVFHPNFRDNDLKREAVKIMAKKLGGRVVGEFGYGSLRKNELAEERANRLKALKAGYDPNGIFNRGKVL